MPTAPASDHSGLAGRLARWWERHVPGPSGLDDLPGHEVERIAHDLGLAESELVALDHAGPEGAALMGRVAAQLGIDVAALRKAYPDVMRDIDLHCSLCGSKERCREDLVAGMSAAGLDAYCPNAATFHALQRERSATEPAVGQERTPAATGRPITHILVAIDGSAGAERALAFALDAAARYQARLSVVHVVVDAPLEEEEWPLVRAARAEAGLAPSPDDPGTAAGGALSLMPRRFVAGACETLADRRLLGNRLLRAAEAQAAAGPAIALATRLVEGEPAPALLAAAAESAADMIVLGRRGLQGFGAILMGSVSTQVLQRAPQAVVAVA